MDIFNFLQNETFIFYAAAFSVLFFLIGIILVPYVILKIPHDYFSYSSKKEYFSRKRDIAVYYVKMALRNAAALLLFFLGIILLVVPGQGLLTILLAFLLADIPGKYKIEKYLIKKERVYNLLNRFRQKYGKKSFILPED
ncbi:hypothetical protein [Flexistipes sp.]|uniref:hypothetical protein n=1 Tax=Flexistipes sp. TaxID=3088135 RepID=UPI002E21C19E|nr:hypothetical protein [Flexistipes sp.]